QKRLTFKALEWTVFVAPFNFSGAKSCLESLSGSGGDFERTLTRNLGQVQPWVQAHIRADPKKIGAAKRINGRPQGVGRKQRAPGVRAETAI
ncbi:MAG: hypothetical protein J2P52_04855, partial [Blastocatellia bacterium]|nr:hypothetical protein [Blastocatellia bacterium]